MKIAIISDIHGKIHSFKKCLHRLEGQSISRIICLGDVIEDDKVINHELMALFMEKQIVGVIGNHDLAIFDDVGVIPWEDVSLDKESYRFFNKFPIRLIFKNLLFTHTCPTFDKEKTRSGDMAEIF